MVYMVHVVDCVYYLRIRLHRIIPHLLPMRKPQSALGCSAQTGYPLLETFS